MRVANARAATHAGKDAEALPRDATPAIRSDPCGDGTRQVPGHRSTSGGSASHDEHGNCKENRVLPGQTPYARDHRAERESQPPCVSRRNAVIGDVHRSQLYAAAIRPCPHRVATALAQASFQSTVQARALRFETPQRGLDPSRPMGYS